MPSKLWTRLRARGVGELWGIVRDRVGESVGSEATLILFVRGAGGRRPVRDDLVVRRAAPHDGESFARDIGTDSVSSFRARLAAGERCVVVEAGPRLVHATWVTSGPAWTREIRRWFQPPEGDLYVFESFTRPEARGRGIYPVVLTALAADAAEEGVGRLWVGVVGDNAASLRAVAKAGFEEAFRVRFRRRFGRLEMDPPHGPEASVARSSLVARRERGRPS